MYRFGNIGIGSNQQACNWFSSLAKLLFGVREKNIMTWVGWFLTFFLSFLGLFIFNALTVL